MSIHLALQLTFSRMHTIETHVISERLKPNVRFSPCYFVKTFDKKQEYVLTIVVQKPLNEIDTAMIYDVNSPLFRSFLSQKGGSSDKRKIEEQRPKEQRPKANENKPVMNE
ncbi:hypothetical protein R6Q57_002714 [Mikania cordata]